MDFYAMDYVGNKSASLQYYFVKKGKPYLTNIANQKEVTQGETVTFDVNAANQGGFKKVDLEFKYDPNVLSFIDIALVEEMKDRFDAAVPNEDIEVSKRIKEAGELMGIEVLDSIIVSHSNGVSLREKGLI